MIGENRDDEYARRQMNNPYQRARIDAYQDRCENCSFASVGGLEKRLNMEAPRYIAEADLEEYLRGYRDQAQDMYGDDWATCSFEWAPALMIPGVE
jgi:hypothetical protein